MPIEGSLAYQPLILHRYGIQLRRMTEADKETVRNGRNKDFVRNNHVHQKIISTEEHEAWFQEVSSPLHYVLIIHYRERDVGAVIVRDFLPELYNTSCGAFIWDEDFIGTKVPILSILIALDFFFFNVGILSTRSTVLKSNSASVNMNKFFGFSFSEKNAESYTITMDKSAYFSNRDRLMTFACRAAKRKEDQQLRMSGTRSPLNLTEINSMLSV